MGLSEFDKVMIKDILESTLILKQCKNAGWKLSVLTRNSKFMSFEHRQIGLKCFIVPFVQFKKREKPMEECYFK